MANDNYIMGRLYFPLIMIVVLCILTYFHRHHLLKYLYLTNIVCYIIAILTYFIIISQPIGENHLGKWYNVVAFTWLISFFGGFFLSLTATPCFFIEQAQRHLWARVICGIGIIAYILSSILLIAWVILGILSLNSG